MQNRGKKSAPIRIVSYIAMIRPSGANQETFILLLGGQAHTQKIGSQMGGSAFFVYIFVMSSGQDTKKPTWAMVCTTKAQQYTTISNCTKSISADSTVHNV